MSTAVEPEEELFPTEEELFPIEDEKQGIAWKVQCKTSFMIKLSSNSELVKKLIKNSFSKNISN